MINFDQLQLLQEKVETAVRKITDLNKQVADLKDENSQIASTFESEISQLKEENAALRSRCEELTNALSDKTELVSNLQADQSKIEESILSALNKLDTVENTILSSSSPSPLSDNQVTNSNEVELSPESENQAAVYENNSQVSVSPAETQTVNPEPAEESAPVNNNSAEDTGADGSGIDPSIDLY